MSFRDWKVGGSLREQTEERRFPAYVMRSHMQSFET